MEAGGPFPVDVGVGHDGTATGEADLTAVGVAGKGDLVPIGLELFQHAWFRGVQQCDGQVGIGVRGTSDLGVVIEVVVWVVDTRGGEPDPADLELHPLLVGISPATFDEGSPHALPGKINIAGWALPAQQVTEGVDQAWRPVVVGAEDEHPGAVEQGAQCLEDIRHGLFVTEVVTGVDHQIGLQGIQGGHPRLLGVLAGDHVQIGDMQDAELLLATEGPGLEKWQRVGLELEFRELGITPGSGAQSDGDTGPENATGGLGEGFNICWHVIHPTRGVHWESMSDLKKKIREDLTTSMKARDKEKTGTLRMLLSALTQEETTGAKHELTDEDVLRIIAREIKKRRESAEIYTQNGREELASAELNEASILEAYQPAQLSDEELEALIDDSIAEISQATGEEVTMKHMGQVMKAATGKAAGQVDGKRLSTAVKSRLS